MAQPFLGKFRIHDKVWQTMVLQNFVKEANGCLFIDSRAFCSLNLRQRMIEQKQDETGTEAQIESGGGRSLGAAQTGKKAPPLAPWLTQTHFLVFHYHLVLPTCLSTTTIYLFMMMI